MTSVFGSAPVEQITGGERKPFSHNGTRQTDYTASPTGAGPRIEVKMKLKRSESDVLKSVRELLKARGILHFRRGVGAFRNSAGQHVAVGHPGEADIEAIVKVCPYRIPTPVYIECKASFGKQSQAQKLFQNTVEQYECTYLLVRSAEEVEAWLRLNT